MTIFETFLLITYVAFFIPMVWILWCNEKTLDQRMAYLNSIPIGRGHYAEFRRKMDIYDKVDYYTHLKYLILFKDPMKLYEE